MIYGYCRVSTAKQHIERQIRNILKTYPDAKIITEVYTGRKFQGRKEMDKLLKILIPGDTIVFDSVSRMSRNAEEGWLLYEELYNMGIHLVFLNEPHVNTDVYRTAVQAKLSLMLENLDKDMERITKILVDAVNDMILILAQRQVKLAFEQSEKEVTDLRTRTSQGLREAKAKGHTNGRRPDRHPSPRRASMPKLLFLNTPPPLAVISKILT